MPTKTRKNKGNKSSLRGGVSHVPHKTRYINKYKLGKTMRRFAAKPGQSTTKNIIMQNVKRAIAKTPRASTRINKEAGNILVKLVDELILQNEVESKYADEEYD